MRVELGTIQMKFAFKVSVQLWSLEGGIAVGCPCCWPVYCPVHVVNTPVLGTMFQFVRRTPSKSRDCARARNAAMGCPCCRPVFS